MGNIRDTLWDHLKTGKRYRITGFGINEATMIPEVQYEPEDHPGANFHRPCITFFDGRFVPVERPPAKEPYDPKKPLEVDWDAIDLGLESPPAEGTQPSLLRPATAASQMSRVEDVLGNDLRIGDWVTLASDYSEDIRFWNGLPSKARKIVGFVDGNVQVEGSLPRGVYRANVLRFYRRERQRMSPTEHA